MGLLEIKCPLCKGTLWVERTSGKVVDHKSAEKKTVDFNQFLQKEKERPDQWDEKMKKSKESEQKRKKEWEERFNQARENPDEIEGEYESPFQWD